MKGIVNALLFFGVAWVAAGCCSMGCKRGDAKPAETVPTDASAVTPLLPGSDAPVVVLKEADGKPATLQDALDGKPSVIVFYRGGWCPFCNRQLSGLNEAYPDLQKLGYQLIAISTDRPGKLGESVKKLKLSYRLLSDNDMDAAKAFGIAFKIPDDLVTMYKTKYGIDVEADSGRTHHLLPVPSVFLVSANGKITFSYVNPDYKKRLSPQVILAAAADALKPTK